MTEMPKPTCRHGYTVDDLERYFRASRGMPHSLFEQLHGQTGVICEGKQCDEAHGPVVYVHDVCEWVEGKPVSDW